ncbi:MAG: PilZ domain-containing protein [Terriglobales bacterium]
MVQKPLQPRRSDRVLIRIPVEIMGDDPSGQQFCDKGITHFVNRHGGSIVLKRTLTSGQQFVVRRADGLQAEIRVVGQLGIGPAGQFYGISFLNPNPDFWGIRFPSTSDPEGVAKVFLQCEVCGSREIIELDLIQLEVFQANESLEHRCQKCAAVTRWTETVVDAPAPRAHRIEDVELARAESSKVTVVPAPKPTPSERRHNGRLKVKMTACIPPPDGIGGDDLVQVFDLSKGGVRLRSHKRYRVGQWIQIAVPYTPGAANIFSQARIVWHSTSTGGWNNYGLKYVKTVNL